MAWFYSLSTGGFYLDAVHGDAMPSGCVPITDPQYTELLAGQAEGQVITDDGSGNPVLTAPPEPASGIVAAQARVQRDSLLAQTDWVVIRSAETGIAIPTGWVSYRQALRDLPAQKGFPVKIKWPVAPAN